MSQFDNSFNTLMSSLVMFVLSAYLYVSANEHRERDRRGDPYFLVDFSRRAFVPYTVIKH
jgi:hypothetical protein